MIFFYNHQRPDMTRVSLFSFAMDFDVYNSYVVISGIFSSVKSKKMLVIIHNIVDFKLFANIIDASRT